MKRLSNFSARLFVLLTPVRRLFNWLKPKRKDSFKPYYLLIPFILLSCKGSEQVTERVVETIKYKDTIIYKSIDKLVYRDSIQYKDSINKVWITKTRWVEKWDTVYIYKDRIVTDTIVQFTNVKNTNVKGDFFTNVTRFLYTIVICVLLLALVFLFIKKRPIV